MAAFDTLQANLLETIAGLRDFPDAGAYNIRLNGTSAGCKNSANIRIAFKPSGAGLEVHVAPGTKGEKVHIPVIIDRTGIIETVYNDFFIGEEADVEIVAGCGIHSDGGDTTQHDGIHAFHVSKNARVLYTEKHYGAGADTGRRVLNPVTEVTLEEGGFLEMETVQIEGVDRTKRVTRGVIGPNATLLVREKLLTAGAQEAETVFDVVLAGENSRADIVSRSVAKGTSRQAFLSKIDGNNACRGHSECDAIIMDNACVKAVPEITANHVDASLIHEAAIGKIAGEQITKLMTLGLTQAEAEAQIVSGFLK